MPLEVSDGLAIRPRRAAPVPVGLTRDIPPAPTAFKNPLGIERINQGHRRSWCWAACGTMLGRFIAGQAQLRRCELVQFVRAQLHREQADLRCCEDPVSKPDCLGTVCETVGEIDAVLRDSVRLSFERSGRVGPEALKAEIAAGRPVQIAFEWHGSTPENVRGHVILVQGFVDVPRQTPHGTELETFFIVIDPLQEYDPDEGPPLDNRVSYDGLRTAYGSGRWSFSWTALKSAGGGTEDGIQ